MADQQAALQAASGAPAAAFAPPPAVPDETPCAVCGEPYVKHGPAEVEACRTTAAGPMVAAERIAAAAGDEPPPGPSEIDEGIEQAAQKPRGADAAPVVVAEPSGLALVADADGDRWVSTGPPGTPYRWSQLAGPASDWADMVEAFGPVRLVDVGADFPAPGPAAPAPGLAPAAALDPGATTIELCRMLAASRSGGRLDPSDISRIAQSVARLQPAPELPEPVELEPAAFEPDHAGTALLAAVQLLAPADAARLSRADVDQLTVAARRTARAFERHLQRDRSKGDDELGEDKHAARVRSALARTADLCGAEHVMVPHIWCGRFAHHGERPSGDPTVPARDHMALHPHTGKVITWTTGETP